MTQDELFRNINQLHPIPKILFQLSDALASSNATTTYIETIIAKEPVLTAKILQLVNSAYFSPLERIKSLRQAIILLGFDTVKNLAAQVCVHDIIRAHPHLTSVTGDALLLHSMAVGNCIRFILQELAMEDSDALFMTMATLHDIGLIIEDQLFHEQFTKVITTVAPDSGGPTYLELEKIEFEYNHAEISQLFCEAWHISPVIGDPLPFHHNYLTAPEDIRWKAAILNLADVCIQQLHIGFFFPFSEPREEGLLKYLNLSGRQYQEIFKRCSTSSTYFG